MSSNATPVQISSVGHAWRPAHTTLITSSSAIPAPSTIGAVSRAAGSTAQPPAQTSNTVFFAAPEPGSLLGLTFVSGGADNGEGTFALYGWRRIVNVQGGNDEYIPVLLAEGGCVFSQFQTLASGALGAALRLPDSITLTSEHHLGPLSVRTQPKAVVADHPMSLWLDRQNFSYFSVVLRTTNAAGGSSSTSIGVLFTGL